MFMDLIEKSKSHFASIIGKRVEDILSFYAESPDLQVFVEGPRWVTTLVGGLGVLLGVWFAFVLWALLTTGVNARVEEMLSSGSMPPLAPW